jgi:PleD family two-component response regulator
MQDAVKAVTIIDQNISFAYGISHSVDLYKDMDEMLSTADKLMYQCKKEMKSKEAK